MKDVLICWIMCDFWDAAAALARGIFWSLRALACNRKINTRMHTRCFRVNCETLLARRRGESCSPWALTERADAERGNLMRLRASWVLPPSFGAKWGLFAAGWATLLVYGKGAFLEYLELLFSLVQSSEWIVVVKNRFDFRPQIEKALQSLWWIPWN